MRSSPCGFGPCAPNRSSFQPPEWRTGLEDKHLISRLDPVAEQVHAAGEHSFDDHSRSDPAGRGTRTSGDHLPPPGDRNDHPLDADEVFVLWLGGLGTLYTLAE